MNLFYCPEIEGPFIELGPTESRHIAKVLRRNIGDIVPLTDGKGYFYQSQITAIDKRAIQLQIVSKNPQIPPSIKIHLGLAPTKNLDRLEWCLEKCTEIGISSFYFLRCDHSERKNIRLDRLEKIVISAMKQSLSAWKPNLFELQSFDQFITTAPNGQKFIAHCQTEALPHLQHNCQAGKDVSILIGPEGDFSPKEIKMANEHGFSSVSLGSSRLRTETAGICACHIVNLKNDQHA